MFQLVLKYTYTRIATIGLKLTLELTDKLCRLDSGGCVKVGDFGLAEDVYSVGYFRQDIKRNVKLPYKWMALESLSDSLFSEKTDVVSLQFGQAQQALPSHLNVNFVCPSVCLS